jgi:hypothetical protein
MTRIVTGARLYLPFRSSAGNYSTGIITRAEAHRFRVTWDSPGRLPRQSRLRTWHPQAEAHRFRFGNPGPDTE